MGAADDAVESRTQGSRPLATKVTSAAELVSALHANSSEKHFRSVTRLGIPPENSIGVPMGVIRQLAREVTPSSTLARELWGTGLHEARLLATLVFERAVMTRDEAFGLLDDVQSWDLCDHLCNNLFRHLDDAPSLVPTLAVSDKTYVKRAAFALAANLATHTAHLTDATFDEFFALIEREASDARLHVKKAVSWALREIGQCDLARRDRAIAVAERLVESGDKHAAWVGRNALAELVRLEPRPGSRRLRPIKT